LSRYLVAILLLCGLRSAYAANEDNNSPQPKALNAVGITALHQLDPSLAGSGVRIGVVSRSYDYIGVVPQNDYRPNADHKCFNRMHFDWYNDALQTPDISPHATAICSLLFGYDPNANSPALGTFEYFGVAPEASPHIFEFRHFVSAYVFPQRVPAVDVLTMSLGTQFDEWWTRGICALSERTGIPVIAAIGNGASVQDPVLFPAGSPNVIGVGTVEANSIDPNIITIVPSKSSFGIIHGRTKPDIIAPGNCLVAITDEPNRYAMTENCSSFSTPLVAGTVALLAQAALADPNLRAPDPNCVFKAILLNSARKLPGWHRGDPNITVDHNTPLDAIQGAGLLDAFAAYKQFTAGMQTQGDINAVGWDSSVIDLKTERQKTYIFRGPVSEPAMITATLTWNRHFEPRYPFAQIENLDSDLRLELWAIQAGPDSTLKLVDYSDSAFDNVEHLYTPADPGYSYYILIVKPGVFNTADTAEHYALAWNFNSPVSK
jgi:hypothetical protein